MKKFWWVVVVAALAALTLLLSSCQGAVGPTGPAGAPGAPGESSGTIAGVVTNSLTKKPVTGVAVATDPKIEGVTITSGGDGKYSAELPIGSYKLAFTKGNFTAATETAVLVAGQTVTKDVVLKPVAAVVANAGADQNASPEGSVTLKATAESLNDSTVTGYKWTQTAGVAAKISNSESDTTTVTLGKAATYKDALLAALNQQDRFTVQAINPHSLEAAEIATFKVTVTTASGTYSDTINVVASLPYVVNGGIANVPVGLPVLLHAKTQGGYRWALTAPSGSKAALDNSSDQNPAFTPDVSGQYVLSEKTSSASINVYAGTWAGAISGQDAKGRPVSAACTVCHNGTTAPDQFTAWKATGHAEILTNNINDPAGHWSLSCAGCHSVGYSPGVSNGGFSDAIKAEGWTAPAHGDPTNWATMLKDNPKSASLANIQCENCHGPNNTVLHTNGTVGDAARVSLSADVCGACHGEPARHGRFQQWEVSRHSGLGPDAGATPERATSSSCARCHSAQGFLLWLKQGDLTKQIQGAKGNATADEMTAMGFTLDKLEPVTCVVCHDPHDIGTTTGEPTNAKVRIVNNTMLLPSGFQAKEVGKGAICITCHNTRNAVHNIDAPPTSYSAPHQAAQSDVLLGENAYFVGVPQRSPHSYVKDTCVTCHMEATPPPAEFSYQQSGTNHSFSASIEICKDCHSDALNAEALQIGTEDKLEKLGARMGTYLLNKLPASITIKDYTAHEYKGAVIDVASDAIQISKDNIASLEPAEPHGQQGFIIKFKNSVTFTYRGTGIDTHTVSSTEAEVRLGDITTNGTTAVIATTDVLVKAGWNYFLIHGDSSNGIHNPAFINDVLDASINALR